MQLVKTALTSDYMTIVDKYLIDGGKENYANGIFFSDKIIPLKLDTDDRRFVVFKCETKIDPKVGVFFKELDKIEAVRELESFYKYLLNYQNIRDVELLHTESKNSLLKVAKNSEEEFIDEILEELCNFYFENSSSRYILKNNNELIILLPEIKEKLVRFASLTRTTPITYQVLLVKLLQLTFGDKKQKIFETIINKNMRVRERNKVVNVFILKFTEKFMQFYEKNKSKDIEEEILFDDKTGEVFNEKYN
jgi:hypothetical protein